MMCCGGCGEWWNSRRVDAGRGWPTELSLHFNRVEFFPKIALTLILVTGQHTFFRCQVREECEASGAIGGNSAAVDHRRPAQELAEIIPIEVIAIRELPYQMVGVETVAR